jgi:tetratricopeptide (TPR) repeat protein
MQDSASFWTAIKTLEEQLSKAPDSFCFARLSSVYLKAGLIDDALHVAREGIAKHPDYLAGQRALSTACHAKGLNDEALAALQRIVVAIPEDIPSQKLLGRLLVEAGDQDSALQVFRIALEFAPEDVECRLQLESLERSAEAAECASISEDGDEENGYDEYDENDEEIIEDLEILEEFDEEFSETEPLVPDTAHDPLLTATLAELYVKQGYINKALEIYRAILNDNPMDQAIKERVAELEAALTESLEIPDDTVEFESSTLAVPLQGIADNARATLDGWLENIRRIKSCR